MRCSPFSSGIHVWCRARSGLWAYRRVGPIRQLSSRSHLCRVTQDRALAARPDLKPAIDLQRSLIATVVELIGAIELQRLPRLSLPPKYVAAKLSRGVPALASEPIPVPVAALTKPLLRLCRELAAGGAGEAADHVVVDPCERGRVGLDGESVPLP